MKNSPSLRTHRGFSMVELMVVIGIIVILAGILIGSLPGIQASINRNKIKTFLAEIEDGLSKYQLDNGIYPLNEPTGGDRDGAGVTGASVLYKHLSGDFDLNGEVDFQNNEKIYVQRLDFNTNREAREPRSTNAGGQYMVIDSFGDPVRYLAQPPNLPRGQTRLTRSPAYDLWSLAGADPGDGQLENKIIANWQGL
jgi:prepilin-type N-terminal cleavage/methylation domain-containing protein